MKRVLTLILAAAMILSCLFAVSCTKEEEPSVTVKRSFIAGHEKTVAMGENEMQMSGRILMNLMSDGTLDVYVGFVGMGSYENAHYTGTYTLGENEELDETITFEYTYEQGKTETVSDKAIIGGVFKTPFYMISSMTSNEISFYEVTPVPMEGEVYVGYMSKATGGMGAMVYAYALNMKDDGTFGVSIMQKAAVMHTWDRSEGTYTTEGDQITFTYDVMDGEGVVMAEDYVSEGTRAGENELSAGFNISQTTVRAADASFIKVN